MKLSVRPLCAPSVSEDSMFLPGDYSLDSYSVPSVWRYIYHSFIKLLKFLITCIIRLDEVDEVDCNEKLCDNKTVLFPLLIWTKSKTGEETKLFLFVQCDVIN